MSSPFERLAAALADRYRIERELGQGGMATVYLAEDIKHKRKVALKVLKPELAAVLGAERFVQEITTTAALQHPHILPLFDSGTVDGFLFYVMPFIDGETLRTKLDRERQLGVDEAVRITREVADALDYAHRHGVIHRDIKPENILLHDGRPMVADFGIALAVSAAAGGRMTETGLSLGTPHYMSPEQATAEKEITARSDVYSLGSVLFEMLAGEPPHSGGSAQAIIMKIIAEPAEPVTKYRKSVPPNVAAAVAKAIEKVPADRFASAKSFADALADAHFTSTSIAASVGAGVARVERLTRRALIATSALVIALLAWIVTRPSISAPVIGYRIALPPEQTPDPQGFAMLTSDGSKLIYLGPAAPGGSGPQLWMKARESFDAVPIPGTAVVSAGAVSPDDRSLAFVQGEFLRRMPIAGGAATQVARGVSNVPAGVAWLDEGAILYVGISGGAIYRVPEDGGESRPVWSSDSLIAFGLVALPRGRGALFIACAAPCARALLLAIDAKGGAATLVTDGVRFAQYLSTGHLLMVDNESSSGVVAPFDLRSREIRGAPVAVLDSVGVIGTYSYVAVSRNGTLVFRRGARQQERILELVALDRAGRESRIDSTFTFRLTRFLTDYGWMLSPDARRLVIGLNTASGDDIWIKALPRGPLSRVTFGASSERRPQWSPDGRHVLYAGDDGVFLRRADGTGGDSLLHRGSVNEAALTPDGRWLVFRTGARGSVAGGRDIYGLRIGVDTAPVPVLVTPFDENAFVFSPDGKWMAYESDETGRREIFVRPFPNTRDSKVQVSDAGGVTPRWSRDGRELYFVSADDHLMSVAVRTGPAFRAGEPARLFKIPQATRDLVRSWYTPWDVTPDGRFMMVRHAAESSEGSEPPLIVVHNWFAELKTKVPR